MTKMLERMRIDGKSVPSPRGLVPTGASDIVYLDFLSSLQIYSDNPVGRLVRLALATSDDVRYQGFLELAMSDLGKNLSLSQCAKQCQISLVEFQAFWLDAHRNRAVADAIVNLPSLTKDMIDDAKTTEVPCPVCDAVGLIQREGKPDKVCPNCSGKGTVRFVGDKHSRDKLLEMTGAIKKDPPVQVNLNMRGFGMEAASTKMQQAVPFDLEPAIDVESTTIDGDPDPE